MWRQHSQIYCGTSSLWEINNRSVLLLFCVWFPNDIGSLVSRLLFSVQSKNAWQKHYVDTVSLWIEVKKCLHFDVLRHKFIVNTNYQNLKKKRTLLLSMPMVLTENLSLSLFLTSQWAVVAFHFHLLGCKQNNKYNA